MFEIRFHSLLLGVALLVALATTVNGERTWVWSRDTGWINPNIKAETDEEQLAHAIALYTQEHYSSAYAMFKKLAKKSKKPHVVQEAYWYAARAMLDAGKYGKATDWLQKLIETYPSTPRLNQAARLEFEIAEKLDKKGKRGQAADIYTRCAEHAPTSDFADDAQIRVADYSFEKHDYEEAGAAYEQLLRIYPESEWVPKALYNLALCKLYRAVISDYDIETLEKARDALRQYLQQYPDGEYARDCQEKLRTTADMLARRWYEKALFYKRTNRPRAMATVCANLVQKYPDTVWAEKAGNLLQKLVESKSAGWLHLAPAVEKWERKRKAEESSDSARNTAARADQFKRNNGKNER